MMRVHGQYGNSMATLARYFFDLARLRLAPQVFPASSFLLCLTMTAYMLAKLLQYSGFSLGLLEGFVRGLVDLSFLLGAAWIILLITRKASRWRQTSIALAGGNTIFILLNAVLTMFATRPLSMSIAIALLLLMIWQIAFLGHVYRHALGIGMGGGILVAMIYILTSISMKQVFFQLPAQ